MKVRIVVFECEIEESGRRVEGSRVVGEAVESFVDFVTSGAARDAVLELAERLPKGDEPDDEPEA